MTAVKNSISNNLQSLVDKKFACLPVSKQGGSVYIKLLLNIVYNLTDTVIQALQKWIKTFSKKGLLKA